MQVNCSLRSSGAKDFPFVAGCFLSALVGSALTLAVIDLRRKSSSSRRGDMRAYNLINDANERHSEGVTEDNGEDSILSGNGDGDGDGDDDDSISSSEVKDGLDCHGDESSNCQHCYQPVLRPRRQPFSRHSFSGAFNNVDGEQRHSIASLASNNSEKGFRYARNGTKVVVLSEEGSGEDVTVMESRIFDEQVLSKLKSLDESKLLLHRTRAVSALASRLMAAPDEESCYDITSRLLVPLFCVDRCSYVFLKDAEHIIVKGVFVKKKRYAEKMGLDGGNYGGVVKPLKDTMVGLCAETLQQQYCPRTKDSEFEVQRMMHTTGINTILATPILVNNYNFAGAVVISMKEEDAFKDYDRILIQDIAAMLGANIYAKRMRMAAEHSNRISREMLHSMIPSKVIDKIKVFWDESSDAFHLRKYSRSSLHRNSTTSSSLGEESIGSYAWIGEKSGLPRCESVKAKLDFLNQVNLTVDSGNKDSGVIIDTLSMEIAPLTRALYAENVKDVVIIFTDIVNFSEMAMCMAPLEVVDMLHDIFSRFDALCDKHGISKLETIGTSSSVHFVCRSYVVVTVYSFWMCRRYLRGRLHMYRKPVR